jgi:hypothetical protein
MERSRSLFHPMRRRNNKERGRLAVCKSDLKKSGDEDK